MPDQALESPTPRPLRVLVVDDEPQVRLLLEEVLAADGFDVEGASDGREALTVFHQRRPDLLLTDLKMPGMDGWELSEHVRMIAPRLPIVIFTAFGTAFEHQAQARGVVLLHKPMSTAELIRVIRGLLARSTA